MQKSAKKKPEISLLFIAAAINLTKSIT
jgi:hypothetical protein